jgi:hypothetical protein
MGMRFNSERRILKSFCCHQEGKDLAQIEPGPVLEFIPGQRTAHPLLVSQA